MAAIDILIEKISDPGLKEDISREVARMKQQKKFGLVFEEHLPEATPLYDVPIKKKSLVAEKDGFFKVFYRVKQIEGNTLICETQDDKHKEVRFEKDRMVAVAMFGEPIYPYLKPMDEVQNAPDSKLWHTLIEAENYHALQLLVYLYGGMVDCIYIDPPYNTRDRDWKYNNNYVDQNDMYLHSKWLSMMKKRLLLAKKLLRPEESVLIVTIDEKECSRLGCLLEELFPEAKSIQMISTSIKPSGSTRETQFSRVDEYIFFVQFGNAVPQSSYVDMLYDDPEEIKEKNVTWQGLRRRGSSGWERKNSPGGFYPIIFDVHTNKYIAVGDAIPLEQDRHSVEVPEGCYLVWPLDPQGREGRWQVKPGRLREQIGEGTAYISQVNKDKETCSIKYLKEGDRNRVLQGEFDINGRDEITGALKILPKRMANRRPKTMWLMKSHDASAYGTTLLNKFIGEQEFSFPKSLYAVHDAIRFFVANKPNALIVDFFAGSGTTLHAVNLLNSEDGGNRRCIMITNNEIGYKKEKELIPLGIRPGEEEWEKWGIARHVNWPRTKCSILGKNISGELIEDEYVTTLTSVKDVERKFTQINFFATGSALKQKKALVTFINKQKGVKLPTMDGDAPFLLSESESYNASILFDLVKLDDWLDALDGKNHIKYFYIVTEKDAVFRKTKDEVMKLLGKYEEIVTVTRPMKDGFATNAIFFKLGFLDKNSVALARQFKELLPLLWMKAGGRGQCPNLTEDAVPDMLILHDNEMAILNNEDLFSDFRRQMNGREEIRTIFFVTNSNHAFREMASPFPWADTYQLYKDYLENFTINYSI